jgi:transposase-like protein
MKIPQPIPAERRFTINDFNEMFFDNDACLEWLMEQRHPSGIATCSYCKIERKHHRIASKKAWACDYCGTYISPMAGTIFEKSRTPLRLWFYAMYLMSATRCGISAKQIQRECGVTYKTAWRMFKQIRTLMAEDIVTGGGPVEMDETYFGAAKKNQHADKRAQGTYKDKQPIFGIVEREGRVTTKVVADVKEKTLLPIIAERVLPKSTVYTDSYTSYDNVRWMGKNYKHERINHTAGIYVMGKVHTQTIEGFWSLLKRGIEGVDHSVSTKYLQSYCNEYSFRYNRRAGNEPMFTSLLSQVVAKAE